MVLVSVLPDDMEIAPDLVDTVNEDQLRQVNKGHTNKNIRKLSTDLLLMIYFEFKGIVNDVPESIITKNELDLLVYQMPRWVGTLGNCSSLDSLRVRPCERQGQGDKCAW